MIEKTHGIVLRVYPYSRTSHIVSWLTRDHGRVVTNIKGAQRPKSAFLGQYDLFYTCELLFYTRARDHVHIAKECSPLDARVRLRRDWRAAACASYFADMANRICPADSPNPELYRFLETVLQHLAAAGVSPAFHFWCELELIRALGISPQLTACVKCRTVLSAADAGARFSPADGGFYCPRCGAPPAGNALPVAPDALAILCRLQSAPLSGAVTSMRCTVAQAAEVHRFLGLFLAHHLELLPPSRDIAFELISQSGPATLSLQK